METWTNISLCYPSFDPSTFSYIVVIFLQHIEAPPKKKLGNIFKCIFLERKLFNFGSNFIENSPEQPVTIGSVNSMTMNWWHSHYPKFSYHKINFKMSSAKCQSFCPSLNVLTVWWQQLTIQNSFIYSNVLTGVQNLQKRWSAYFFLKFTLLKRLSPSRFRMYNNLFNCEVFVSCVNDVEDVLQRGTIKSLI